MSRTPQQSIERLARNMQIAQIALQTQPAPPLFALQVEALHSACEEALAVLARMGGNERLIVPESLIGRATADVLADALYESAPDTPEGLT